MNRFVLAIKFIKNNIKKIIIFEAIYGLVFWAIVTPSLVELVRIAMRLSGINYLTNRRLMAFATRPTTIAIAVLVLFIYSIFTLVEIGAMTHAYNIYYNGGEVSVMDMIKVGGLSSLRVLSPKNIFMMIIIIALLPTMYIGRFTSFLYSMPVSAFVVEYLKLKPRLMSYATIMVVVAMVISIRYSNVVNYYINERKSFFSSARSGAKLNKKKYIGLVLGFLIWQLMILAILVIAFLIMTLIVSLITRAIFSRKLAYTISLLIAKWIYELLAGVYSFMVVPVTCAYLSGYFFARKKAENEAVVIPKFTQKTKYTSSKPKKILSIIVMISAIANLMYMNFDFGVFRGSTKIQLFKQTYIAAHRGYSSEAPENTIPAIEAAIDNYADYVEIDVQETKDGVVVVMHDSNTKRTTGYKSKIWNITYEELCELDAGSWFSEEFAGTQIPTLEEVFKVAKGRIKLNIEIKLTGHEQNLEKSVVELIDQYDMYNECVVTSFQTKALKKVKRENPKVKTGYILHVAYGDFSKLSYVDALSVNYSFATETFIDAAHDEGLDVYVWTVNNAEGINNMLENGADMIITDDPVLVRETITSYETTPYIVKILKIYFGKLG